MKALGCLTAIAVGCFFFLIHLTVNRIYVPEGKSLQLRYKGPLIFGQRKMAKPGFFAQEGEIGVLAKLRGPGRHFYCPVWYERTLVDDVIIHPKQVGIVTCKLGDPLPEGQFLVDGGLGETSFKGVLRKALSPGRYRINPYAYEVKVVQIEVQESNGQMKHSGWVEIPTGFVGVVTNLADNPIMNQKSGIQMNVLPPGIYPINGREQQVDIVKVGYRESTISVIAKTKEDGSLFRQENGEPVIEGGINFPSSDGFPIFLDYTAIWGLMPDQAPHAIKTFGNVKQVEEKVILPQIESICRNNGSEYSAVDLLVGEKREIYQNDALKEFQVVLEEKDIALLYGLVRHIYIPEQVRKPIQFAFIADELALTRKQEQETAKTEALLREAEKKVDLEKQRIEVDTERQYRVKLAEGDREARTIDAETRKLIATIQKETAEFLAQAKLVRGEAENQGKKMVEEAKASKFALAVAAFGSSTAYNNWIFANALPANLDLKLFYSGEGTLWTDLKNLNVIVPEKKK